MPVKVREGYAPRVSQPFVPGIELRPNIPEGAFGGQIGQALSNLGTAIEGYQKRAKAEAEKMNDFNMRKSVIEETIASKDELNTLMQDAPEGAPNFTEQVNARWQERMENTIARWREEGMDEETIQRGTLHLMGLRETVVGQAMTFQETSFKAKAGGDIRSVGDALVQFMDGAPEELDQALVNLFDTIEAIPDVDAIWKREIYEELRPQLVAAAATAWARDHPQETQQQLRGFREPPKFLDLDSHKQLAGVAPVFNDLMATAERYLPKGYTFQIGDRVHGHGGVGGKRTQEQQDEIVKRGASKTRNSKHVEGMALDLVPFKDGKPDESDQAFAILSTAMDAAARELGVELEWGGNWKNFVDKYHFQVKGSGGFAKAPTKANFIEAAKNAFGTVESSNRYTALGPELERNGRTVRAYGKYQVMDYNIGPWTQEALGRRLTPQQFLNDPDAQDRVFMDQMSKLYDKHGNIRDAASVWFTGVPYNQAIREGRSDGFATVQEYVSRIEKEFGGTGNPIFDKLSPSQRQTLLTAADTAVTAQNDATIADFELRLLNGEITNPRQQYEQMYVSGIINRPEDSRRLLGIIEAQEKDAEDMTRFTQLFSGQRRGNPSDTKDTAAMNAGGQQLMSIIDAGPQAAGQQDQLGPALSAIMNNTGMLPANVVNRLLYETKLGDPARAFWAARQLVSLLDQEGKEGQGSVLSSMLSQDELKRLRKFQVEDGTLPEDRLAESLRPKTWQDLAAQEVVDAQVKTWLDGIDKTDPFPKLLTDFDQWWGPDATKVLPQDPKTYASFRAEYMATFEDFMRTMGGNGDGARKATVEHLKNMWGFNEFNDQFMKYPPTHQMFDRVYPPHIDGTKDWMRQQLRQEFSEAYDLREEDQVFLLSDDTTEREALIGMPPSYLVTIFRPDTGEYIPVFDRYQFEYGPELQQEKAVWEAQRKVDLEAENNYRRMEEERQIKAQRDRQELLDRQGDLPPAMWERPPELPPRTPEPPPPVVEPELEQEEEIMQRLLDDPSRSVEEKLRIRRNYIETRKGRRNKWNTMDSGVLNESERERLRNLLRIPGEEQ